MCGGRSRISCQARLEKSGWAWLFPTIIIFGTACTTFACDGPILNFLQWEGLEDRDNWSRTTSYEYGQWDGSWDHLMVTVLMRKMRPWKLIALALPEVSSTIGGPLPRTSLISKVSVSASDSFKTVQALYVSAVKLLPLRKPSLLYWPKAPFVSCTKLCVKRNPPVLDLTVFDRYRESWSKV